MFCAGNDQRNIVDHYDPNLSEAELLARGQRIIRDHIACEQFVHTLMNTVSPDFWFKNSEALSLLLVLCADRSCARCSRFRSRWWRSRTGRASASGSRFCLTATSCWPRAAPGSRRRLRVWALCLRPALRSSFHQLSVAPGYCTRQMVYCTFAFAYTVYTVQRAACIFFFRSTLWRYAQFILFDFCKRSNQ